MRTIIVGGGHAGGQCAISLRQAKYEGEIILIGDESYFPYERPPLSKTMLIEGISIEKLSLRKDEYYEKQNILIRSGLRMNAINKENKEISLSNGESLSYEHLVIATGGEVRKLSLPGSNLAGIHYIRKINDTAGIITELQPDWKVVVVGGGYIGLEAAAALRKRGHEVKVLEAADCLLGRSVDEEISSFYLKYHQSQGVDIHLNTQVVSFEGADRVSGVSCKDGKTFEADIVIVGIGIIPNTQEASQAGLELNDGILVNEHCQTSNPHIFAIGDVSRHVNAIYGTSMRLESVQNAVGQARVAAKCIAGQSMSYTELPWFWSDQYDLKLQMAGVNVDYDQKVVRGNIDEGQFAVWYLKGNQIQAVHAVNRPRDFMFGKQFIARRVNIEIEKLKQEDTPLKEITIS